jgi:hypothetical protein
MSRSKATPTSAPSAWLWSNWEFFSREVNILGVYPANPFRQDDGR